MTDAIKNDARTIQFELLTPEKIVCKEDAIFVALPGVQGELGVLPEHTHLLTSLIWGEVRITGLGNQTKCFAVSGGFVQISPQRVAVLADTAEPASEIDSERAKRAHERAMETLAQKKENVDLASARAALYRAQVRLKVASRLDH